MQIFTASEKSTSKAGDHKELETHFVKMCKPKIPSVTPLLSEQLHYVA